MDRAAEAELDVSPRELAEDVTSVVQRPCEPVRIGDQQGVTSRQAASANRRPGRSRLVPVNPWSTWMRSLPTPRACSPCTGRSDLVALLMRRAYPPRVHPPR